MWLSSSSVGRKFVMAVTGAVLVLFLTFHCLMNAIAICWPAPTTPSASSLAQTGMLL